MARVEPCPRCREDVSVPANFVSGQLRCTSCRAVFEIGDDSGDRGSEERFSDRPEEEREHDWRRRDEPEEPWLRAIRRNTERAKEKVQGPAVLMMIVGALLVLSGLGAVGFLAIPWMTSPNDPDLIVTTVFFVMGGVMSLVCGGLSFVAGMRLRSMRSYGLAMTATILIMVFGALTCVPLAAAGIWPLIVLMDSEVKGAFREAEEGR